MLSISELMEEVGFEPDTSEVNTLMQDQHYASSLQVGFQMLGDYDND